MIRPDVPTGFEWWSKPVDPSARPRDYTTTNDADPVDQAEFYATIRDLRRDLGIVTFLTVVAVLVGALAIVAVFR